MAKKTHLPITYTIIYFSEPGNGVIPHGDSLLLSLIIGIVVVILVAMALLAILGLALVVCLIRRLVFITRKLSCVVCKSLIRRGS